MFKNLMLYRLADDWLAGPGADLAGIDEALGQARFAECGATQPMSLGWTPPRRIAHAPLIESVAGHWLMTLTIEQKVVPGSVVRRKVAALAERIEQDTGRKPGKKAQRELKDQALLELLPMAFTKQASVTVWIAPAERLLVIDAGTQARADEVLTALAQALPGFSAQRLNTALSPAAAMADWLVSGEPPAGFTIDRDTELKAADGEKPVVRYTRHTLDLDEVRGHIQAGKQPTRLALTWNGRVSFVLTDGGLLKKIGFLDGVFEKQPGASRDEQFDADAAISTGELIPLIGDLVDALGGEQVFGEAAAAPGAAADAAPARPPATPAARADSTAPATTDLPPWEDAAPAAAA